MTRILLIEGDPGERLVLKSRLADLGYEVVAAETGAKGIVEARAGRFEAILIAAGLAGGVDGAEVCRRVKAVPQLAAVPIILYATTTTTPDVAERMYDAGCEVFLPKAQMGLLPRILQVYRRQLSRFEELRDQNRMLEQEARKIEEQAQRIADLEVSSLDKGASSLLVRELAAGRPDGALLVEASGRVCYADRGACELLGVNIVGQSLGQVAPGVGLEAFVRDARTAAREGFRFEVSPRKDRVQRSLVASVLPVHSSDESQRSLRVLLVLDLGKRRIAEELLRAKQVGIPRQQLGPLLEAAHSLYTPEAITGRGQASTELRQRVSDLVTRHTPILIHGARGSGKRHAANVLHFSGKATGPILQLRCGSLSEQDLELELFGYRKGVTPAALADSPGLLLLAQDGTVLLDEIADMPLTIQKKLVEVIDEGKLYRCGSRKAERVEVRLVATTVDDPDALVEAGQLDPTLRARFGGGEVRIPSLLERQEDVPLLVEQFLDRFGPGNGVMSLSDHVAVTLAQYTWPGGISELEDCIEQACARSGGQGVDVQHLPRPLRDLASTIPSHELIPVPRPEGEPPAGTFSAVMNAPRREAQPWDITEDDPISLEHYEMKALLRALDICEGDKLAAARLLKVGKSTLYRKLKRFGIT